MLTIGTNQSLAYFKLLEQNRADYEAAFGEALNWQEKPGQKLKMVSLKLSNADPKDSDDWPRQHKWIYDKLQRLHSTFSQAAKSLDPSEYISEEDETDV